MRAQRCWDDITERSGGVGLVIGCQSSCLQNLCVNSLCFESLCLPASELQSLYCDRYDIKSLFMQGVYMPIKKVYNKELNCECLCFTFYVSTMDFIKSVYSRYVSSPTQTVSVARDQGNCTKVQWSSALPSQLPSTSLGFSYQQINKLQPYVNLFDCKYLITSLETKPSSSTAVSSIPHSEESRGYEAQYLTCDIYIDS